MLCFPLGGLILLISIAFSLADINLPQYQRGSNTNFPSRRMAHGCQLTNNEYPFNVLPGSGWDNLSNREQAQVLKISYDKCKASNDGRFLIPDQTKLVPKMKSIVQLDSNLISHFSKYPSTTSKSINAEASGETKKYSISGSFSNEREDVKRNQLNSKSSISQSQLRYDLYKISHIVDAELDTKFHQRILNIGVLIETKKDSLYSAYLADLIVREFGTHVITSVDAGAVLSKIDILKQKYVLDSQVQNSDVSVAASFSLGQICGFKFGSNFKNDDTKIEEYNNNCASTRIKTIGGGPFGSDFSLEEWEKTLDTNLVAIDRIGEPLYNVITKHNIPEFSDKTIYEINLLVKTAIEKYYSTNTRLGCMDFNSHSFDENANVNSGLCNETGNTYPFGGVYQTCQNSDKCDTYNQKNPATGDYSCPKAFNPIKLFELDNPSITFVWCAPRSSSSAINGYLFGGMYTEQYPNLVTNNHNCPQYYFPVQYGISGKICITQDKELGGKNSLPFGGFYSCKTGNPLALAIYNGTQTNFPLTCGSGYSTHLASIFNNCHYSYCVKNNAIKTKAATPLYRPPFVDLQMDSNIEVVSELTTSAGMKLVLAEDGIWKEEILRTYMVEYIMIAVTVALLTLIAIYIKFKCFVGKKLNPTQVSA